MPRQRATIAVLLMAWGTGVLAGEVEVNNPEAPSPEGPLWRDGHLHHLEYGADTLTNLTFGEIEDTVFVTAASDAWSSPVRPSVQGREPMKPRGW